MPSKNMLPKGQRRRTVKHEYRATRGVDEPTPPPIPVLDVDFDDDAEDHIHTFTADPAAANLRLDQYLAQAIPDISRARVQLLIENGQVRVDGHTAKAQAEAPRRRIHRDRRRYPIRPRSTPRPKTFRSRFSTKTIIWLLSTSPPA